MPQLLLPSRKRRERRHGSQRDRRSRKPRDKKVLNRIVENDLIRRVNFRLLKAHRDFERKQPCLSRFVAHDLVDKREAILSTLFVNAVHSRLHRQSGAWIQPHSMSPSVATWISFISLVHIAIEASETFDALLAKCTWGSAKELVRDVGLD